MKLITHMLLLSILAQLPAGAQKIDIKNDKAFLEKEDPESSSDPFETFGKKPRILEYSVSKASNKGNLMEVFAMVVAHELAKQSNTVSFKVLQRLDSKRYLVTAGARADADTYLLQSDKDINAVDGELIQNVSFVVTDEIYEYESVSGAKRSVRVIKIAANKIPEMTKEEFVTKLKGGATWKIRDLYVKKCDSCFGSGKLSALRNYAKCKECGGDGLQSMHCIVKW